MATTRRWRRRGAGGESESSAPLLPRGTVDLVEREPCIVENATAGIDNKGFPLAERAGACKTKERVCFFSNVSEEVEKREVEKKNSLASEFFIEK